MIPRVLIPLTISIAVLSVLVLYAQPPESARAVYTGDAACLTCHKTESTSFAKNVHNKAYTIIKDTPRYKDLKKEGKEGPCLVCHATGHGEQGGFVDETATPSMAKVGCEGCHGPGSLHVPVSKEDTFKKKLTIHRKPDCGKCHKIHSHEG